MQICSLLSFYINNKLNSQIKETVEDHIENCPVCREKYQALLQIKLQFVQAKEYLDGIESATINIDSINQEEDYVLVQNLSAYSDNELSDEDSLKVKKFVIKNLNARQSLSDIYELRNLLKKSFVKYESQIKDDYSKNVLNKLVIEDEIKRDSSSLKVASILILLLTSFTIGVIYLLTNLLV